MGWFKREGSKGRWKSSDCAVDTGDGKLLTIMEKGEVFWGIA